MFDITYELILNELPYKEDLKLLELLIKSNDREIILQKDKVLPPNRKYTNGYRILCGYYYYGRIAVIIEYEEYIFEGNNRRQMLVTGILKTEELQMQYD